MQAQKSTLALVAILLIGLIIMAVYFLTGSEPMPEPVPEPEPEPVMEAPVATTSVSIIGQSVEGRDIEAHTFGTGETDLLFVGGIHGGYEGNTVRMAELAIDAFRREEVAVPSNVTVHIIPNLNPDGYALPPSASEFDRRMNANGVDLNRNFDCRWEPESTWRSEFVSGGAAPFSEPEAVALRDYVTTIEPAAAIVWHSRANAVYTSECGAGVVAGGEALMNAYAAAAEYRPAGLWTAYPVTGASEDWLASIGIPAITVEFETREETEWERNRAAMEAVMRLYAE